MMTIRTYSQLKRLHTFEERFRYLKLGGTVGTETFGFDRYLNQIFYNLPEWKQIRRDIIIRDDGCDLGLTGYDIKKGILVHHMNPITKEDILNHVDEILDPEYLISTRLMTHNAIHYGDDSILQDMVLVERTPYDTCPWRRK